ncbi:MAG: hypothetical protein ACI8WP_000964 [Flavobacteriaceae bacterium]|jgi:hypothetical protein
MGGECRAALVTINLILRRIALDLPNASLTIKMNNSSIYPMLNKCSERIKWIYKDDKLGFDNI